MVLEIGLNILRGFGRTAKSVAREIRNGRLNLENDKKMVFENDEKTREFRLFFKNFEHHRG